MVRTGTGQHPPTRRLLVAVATTGLVIGLALTSVLPIGDDRPGQASPTPEGSPAASTGPTATPPVAGDTTPAAPNLRLTAVSAAVDFVCSGQALLDVDPLTAEGIIRESASDAAADDLVATTLDGLREVRSVLAEGTGPVSYRQAALAWRVESLTTTAARVAVWNVGVLSREGVAPPQAGWSIITVELVWERDEWRVASETVVPGPAPVLDDSTAPATSAQLDAALDGFTSMGDGL